MLLSIIIPIYNIENYVERCVKSIVQQSFPADQYEVVLVNDGSKDGSLRKLESLQKEFSDKNINIFTKENGGLSSARNFGLEKATANYIWFVDGDDWVSEDSLQKISDELLKYPNLDILEFDLAIATEYQSGFKYDYNADEKSATVGQETGRAFLEHHGYSLGVTVNIYRRDFLQDSGIIFPLGKYSEDNIFSLKTLLKAERFRKINAYFYFYYQRADSISHTKTTEHLRKYYDDIFDNFKEMKAAVSTESPTVQKKISEMIAFFQLIQFISLYKQRKFALAQHYARRMKIEGFFPVHHLSADKGAKFKYFRKLINMRYRF